MNWVSNRLFEQIVQIQVSAIVYCTSIVVILWVVVFFSVSHIYILLFCSVIIIYSIITIAIIDKQATI